MSDKTLADLAADESLPSNERQVGKPERPGIETRPDSVTVIGKPGENLTLGDIDDILRSRGLNPDDWQIKGCVVNEWEANAVIESRWVKATNHQLKVTLIPRPHIVLPLPARIDGPSIPLAKPSRAKSELIVIFPDQQAPWHDERLHELALAWLEANHPHQIGCAGDLTDLPTVSKHPPKAHELDTTVQTGVNAGYRILRDYAHSGRKRCHRRFLIPGNHEHRFQKWLIEKCREIYGITRAEDATPLLRLPYLLRLDELGYEWATDPVYQEDYPQGHVVLGDNLAVYHGWIAKKHAGESARATLEHLGHSVIVGHTHRQAYTPHTYHEIDRSLRILGAWEAGTMARAGGGLGYSVAPDWQPGFITVRLWTDGIFKVEHATYVNGVLIWGEQRYGEPLPSSPPAFSFSKAS